MDSVFTGLMFLGFISLIALKRISDSLDSIARAIHEHGETLNQLVGELSHERETEASGWESTVDAHIDDAV